MVLGASAHSQSGKGLDDGYTPPCFNKISSIGFGGGCIRFLTETECERLMGLPEGWTKYGADGREICSTNRYTALGNAIALPCAEYIMAGIAEVMG